MVLDILALQLCEITIQHILFESLLAEQAARFISMDSSTRNAETILEETILWYNKLRQAKITKELTELIGSF
jgi:F-type H+-transporting ATPase subunit gamma